MISFGGKTPSGLRVIFDVVRHLMSYHRTVMIHCMKGSQRGLSEGSRVGLSGKRSLSKGLRLYINLALFSYVAAYSPVSSECQQPIQHHRPCLISLHLLTITSARGAPHHFSCNCHTQSKRVFSNNQKSQLSCDTV